MKLVTALSGSTVAVARETTSLVDLPEFREKPATGFSRLRAFPTRPQAPDEAVDPARLVTVGTAVVVLE